MIETLLNKLHNRESSNCVFNQYTQPHILNNLRIFLEYLTNHSNAVMLIGEAPGYRGCRLTGIPLTSGDVIVNSSHRAFGTIGHKLLIPCVVKENTATILWEVLTYTQSLPILWNAFPFHPHMPNNPNTNRKPTKEELQEGKHYIQMMYKIFKPRKLIALGRIAELVLKEIFPNHNIIYIRHPSYGGKIPFVTGLTPHLQK